MPEKFHVVTTSTGLVGVASIVPGVALGEVYQESLGRSEYEQLDSHISAQEGLVKHLEFGQLVLKEQNVPAHAPAIAVLGREAVRHEATVTELKVEQGALSYRPERAEIDSPIIVLGTVLVITGLFTAARFALHKRRQTRQAKAGGREHSTS